MPDQKISELTELISAHPTNDVVPVVDTSVDETKKISLANLPMTESAAALSYPYTIDFDNGVVQTRNLTGTSPSGKYLNGFVSGDFGSPNSSTVDSVYIGSNVKIIGDHTFFGFSNLSDITISEGVKSIEEFAFTFCSNLSSVRIPNSVTEIGVGAFEQCTSLTGVTISDNLSFMDANIFGSCSGLTGITIPESVTGIEDSAFKNCTNLTAINLLAPTRPNLGVKVFENVASGATIHVPAGADYPTIFGGLPVSFDLTS